MRETGLSNLSLRIISAVILAPIAIGALYLGGLWFTLFLALAAIAMAWEWCSVSFENNVSSFFSLVTLWVLVSIYLVFEGYVQGALWSLLVCVIGLFALTWFRRAEKEWKLAFLGPVYIGLPVISLLLLRDQPDVGFQLTLSLFFIVWAMDTGAYFAGRALGGPKIWPAVSPKKTWAGLIGGLVAAAIVAWLCNRFMMSDLYTVGQAIIGGILLALVSHVGDFLESAWKRHFNVKDASTLIPGHGGVLDRLDGVLFAAPALYVLEMIGRT